MGEKMVPFVGVVAVLLAVAGATTAPPAVLERYSHLELGGYTPVKMYEKYFLNNPDVTDAQLLAISQLKITDLAETPEARRKTLEKIPNVRFTKVHRFTVALMHGLTHIPFFTLSGDCPALGVTGNPNTPLLTVDTSERLQRITALHDTTDYLSNAGVPKINKSVWG